MPDWTGDYGPHDSLFAREIVEWDHNDDALPIQPEITLTEREAVITAASIIKAADQATDARTSDCMKYVGEILYEAACGKRKARSALSQ